MKSGLILVSLAAAVAAFPAHAVSFFSIGGAPDPGLAPFETSLIDFDGLLHSGITQTLSGTALVYHVNTPSVAAAPAGDTTSFMGIGTGGSATYDFSSYFAGKQVKSISVYVGSVDAYNHIDILSGASVLTTINGADLPGSNGDQGAAITNRRLYINFTSAENVTGLRFRSDGVAFEFDTIGASSAVFAPIPPTIPGKPDPAPPVLPAPLSGGLVPEPASWAMMIAGFGMIGVAARRRRSSAAAA